VVARRGFTLIEILLALSIVGLLLTLALPRYFASLERSKEIVLQENLKVLRSSIDKFYGDTGKYPESLSQLVEKNYLRSVPVDPVSESAETWIAVAPRNSEDHGIYDVKSGAQGRTRAGVPFGEL
jgi:general secretion pathway protein G